MPWAKASPGRPETGMNTGLHKRNDDSTTYHPCLPATLELSAPWQSPPLLGQLDVEDARRPRLDPQAPADHLGPDPAYLCNKAQWSVSWGRFKVAS